MKISVRDLQDGMRIDQDLHNQEGQLIITKNTLVTPDIIQRLKKFHIRDIEAEATPEQQENFKYTLPDYLLGDEEDAFEIDSEKENIFDVRHTEAFNTFKDSCESNKQTLTHSLDDIISENAGNEKLYIMEALSDSLYEENKNNINLIDMVYLMRNNADSIYSHSLNVAMVASQLGKWLNFSEDDVQMLVTCGLFHDVGKLMIPKYILDKPSKLTDEEYEIMKTHALKGYELLSNFDNLDEKIKITALNHHERCDGSGYPNGRKGNEIDEFSKILAIADVYTAMTSDRIYRQSICPFSVAAELEKEGLHKFDSHYVMTFLDNMLTSYLQRKVELSNGKTGTVILLNRYQKSRPLVELSDGEALDLAKCTDINITKMLDY